MMIIRKKYIEEVWTVLGKQVIKVLLGMRRVGKSTLFLQIQNELKNQGVSQDQIISINFEWLEYDYIRNYQKLNKFIEDKMITDKKYYVFLDEIQEVEGFEKVVNSINSKGQAEIFITGSNSKLLSGELATYLTGRFYTIEVLPLSFGEIFNDAKPSDEQFLDYVRYGGMPGRFQFDDSRTAKNYIMDMYHSILLRDIVI